MNDPLVSVVVTAYNQSNTVAQTLESILTQECDFQYELIVSDDCSTDRTRDICIQYQKSYPNIVKLLFHSENLGVAANFALSVKQSKGKYIAVCAADDFWHNPKKLQLQVNFFNNNPNYGLLYTDYDKLNIQTKRIIKNYLKTSHKKLYEGADLIKDFFRGRVPVLTLTVMFRKDLFEKNVPAEDYIKYRFPLEDWPTWLILSKYTKIGYLSVSTATYRYGHESISNPLFFKNIEIRFAKEKLMYKYLCNMFPKDLSYSESDYMIYVNGILLNLAYKKFDFSAAKKYAKKLKEFGSEGIKVKMTLNKFTFNIFALLKLMKQNLKE